MGRTILLYPLLGLVGGGGGLWVGRERAPDSAIWQNPKPIQEAAQP